jgi:hypothetical protein
LTYEQRSDGSAGEALLSHKPETGIGRKCKILVHYLFFSAPGYLPNRKVVTVEAGTIFILC